MRKAALPLLLLSLQCMAADRAIPSADTPADLKRLISSQEMLLDFKAADLNGDGLSDYVFVVQPKNAGKSADEDEGERTLKIAIRQPDKSLKVVKSNGKVVFCEKCGGVFGDPFDSLSAGAKTFSVNHYGGSNWRWSNTFKFNYSRKDDTWQLVQVDESSFHTSDPNKAKNKTYRPPKDFGKIDISEFDPEKFKGAGAK